MISLAWLNPNTAADDVTYSTEERKIFASTLIIGGWVIAFGVVGVVCLIIWAYGVTPPKPETNSSFSVVLGADLLIAAAAAAAGALLGFIFAIPRTLDLASQAAVASAATQSATGSTQAAMAANTNLERISDWLTTLLIGAALVQIKDIARWIGELGNTLFKGGPITNELLVRSSLCFSLFLRFSVCT